ncbi:MAG: nickel pincer cofactor biosynthesis protein LarC [Dehalococcoidia bacterium]|nr:MAG: nickel pincer cofactor biosynthesis protein LarC [Dehalococcoidia bacterium]
MTKVGYLDCFSGASGDMILGALVDAGLSLESLRAELAKLPLTGYRLSARKVRRAGLAASQVRVTVAKKQPPRRLADILSIIEGGSLLPGDKEKGTTIFRRLAEAEAKVHGLPAGSQAHLHEVGAVDAIVDVMGTVAGLRLLGVEELFASALALGGGATESAGGALPLPAPATLELVASVGAPTTTPRGGEERELLTPTGAAIITTLARFQRPPMKVECVGYGAGSRDVPGWPNVLRLWLGTSVEEGGRLMLLAETNIDDMSPEILGYVQERLFASGAADVWLTPVQMKKGRPGVMLSVICPMEAEDAIVSLLLRETSTLGVRLREVRRQEAEREVLAFESSLGPAVVKVKRLPGERPQAAPEYGACRRLAEASGRPLAEVYSIVQGEAQALLG